MNASDMEISYECLVELRHYGSDWNNYQTVDTEVIVETADNLESLYIKLGTHKTNETPVEDRIRDNYTIVEFGKIRKLAVMSEDDADMLRINDSPAMQRFQMQREEKARAKEIAKAKLDAAQEAWERAELTKLTAKYGKGDGK